MRIVKHTAFTAALLAAALATITAPTAFAASSASSAASDSIGVSSNGASASLRTSSNSSTKKDVAQGDYRVIDVAVDDTPGMLRVRLQAVASSGPASDDNAFLLVLPQAVFERSGVASGQVVSATQRPYGLEFARADTKAAFFLVLTEGWMQELQSHPVLM